MTNLVTDVASTVDKNPEATAIAYDGQELSYEAFWSRTGKFAAGLDAAGIDPGDRVGIYLPNLPQYVVAFHGALRAGAVVVPMNPQYKSREIGHLLSDSGAELVVTLADLVPVVESVREETAVETVVSVGGDADGSIAFEEFLGESEPSVVERADDDVACQPYTSGTTGQPKGVLLTHRNLASNARMAADLAPDGTGVGDRSIGVLPLFHIYGMTVTMNAALFSGAAYYPLPEWDAQTALSLIENEELTIMQGVPAMFNDLVNQPNADEFDLSTLRFVNSGGSSLPIEVLRRFEERFGFPLYEGYGLTETSPVTHFNMPDARRVGSIGHTLDGVDAMIVDTDFEPVERVSEGPVDEGETDLDAITGELVVAGPNVMKGYHDRPAANEEVFTEQDGQRWFHTGDIGYWDEDDFFYIVDREKHMIVTGGYNVYPREVEELLFEHPDVADAAVVGIPDERRGETVKAFVVPASAASGGSSGEGTESDGVPTPDADVTEDEIREFCLERLAEYKHPREVAFVDELPRTTTGKVQKFELRGHEDGATGEESEEVAE
ncbi:acyl-CoA synthetase (AMP-forming)/AMP-acid ligase II [Halococcus morrhuae DSM 1307]|uniref:Acyl-CoA synthetase (AMP-forming)/AMP-acid ligase II n=1 Tax=Halococcus morrhuae DSM 1307 TaxID=931277 RepID=M0MR57_HALMO|nr:long-chain fatty acid--CoA ligase [Halococcus morrhuae]EMA48091.1 acyl-CoA synthetase (AMP-forming)/AMP-acid ligase II [Halococcus morrhuae DSM 1307]